MSDTGTSRVAVLGAGLIGIDLLDKILFSTSLRCALVAGRDPRSVGLRRAAAMGIPTTAGGVTALAEAGPFEVVFDASSAAAHTEHAQLLASCAALLVDLTPSSLGQQVVPTVNGADTLTCRHINLISCGGQASLPLLHAIAQHCEPQYVEVVTTAASATAGHATRLNLDEYIETTQQAIRTFTGAPAAKVMVNISPADPPPPFRVAITVRAPRMDEGRVRAAAESAAREVRAFAPGFAITSCAVTSGKATVAAEVTAPGGRLPGHAGNLHIINAAAVLLAEQHEAATAQTGTS